MEEQLLNYLTMGRRRRPGLPLKGPLDGYNRKAETGHLLAYLRDRKKL
jgi:hypothetical protein